MARTEATLTKCAITQYLDPEYWQWPEDVKQHLPTATADQLAGYVVKLLEADPKVQVESAYAIVHDKDTREVWDELKKVAVTVLKPRHVHFAIAFVKGKGATLSHIAALVGIEPQYVEKPTRGPYGWDNMLSYLCHCKYREKHHYSPEEVATGRGESFQSIYGLRSADWHRAQGLVEAKQATDSVAVEDMRDRILRGELTRSQIILTDEMFKVYARNQQVMDAALSAAAQRRALLAAQKLAAGEFQTRVVFVTGPAGSGKTRWATSMIRDAIDAAAKAGQRWDMYRAATSNPLDDWEGEEVLLLDDLRGAAMTATEWLLLLDPYNASPAAARYRNKASVAPRLIVITSSIGPVEYFYYARQRGDVDEAMDQFIRRLSAIVEVVETGDAPLMRFSLVGARDPYQHLLTINSRTGTWRENITLRHGPVLTGEMNGAQATGHTVRMLGAAAQDLTLDVAEGEVVEMADAVQQHALLELERQRQSDAEFREQIRVYEEKHGPSAWHHVLED